MNWIERQVEWAKSFFSDTYVDGIAGKASSRRIMELAVNWCFIFSYVKVTLATTAFVPLDWTWAVMIGAILGLKSLDLIAQKKATNGNGNGNGSENPPKQP